MLTLLAYFEHIHPIHSFLDRNQFESIARSPRLNDKLTADKSWSALFYAVLALGSQYHDGGGYQPAKTISWRFFATALALFPDLLITKPTLMTVQAFTAMAIFASNVSCLQIEYVMVSEGAKNAQALGFNRSTASGHDPRNRTFWVLFFLEKNMTFNMGRSSSIMDSDICSAILSQPLQSGSISFDWTIASIRISRLFSRIYASLYSVSVRGKSADYYSSTVNSLKSELEAWKTTIPTELQPGQPIRPHSSLPPPLTDVRTRLHYLYHGTVLHLDRTALHFSKEVSQFVMTHFTSQRLRPRTNRTPPMQAQARSELVTSIMCTARTILELTKYIEIQPYTPIWFVPSTLLVCYPSVLTCAQDHCRCATSSLTHTLRSCH